MKLPAPAVVLELLKPITWFAPMWAFLCGILSPGIPVTERLWVIGLGVLLAGPLVCGTSQAVNDWFDRHVDAINEPGRPIPSGRMPGRWGFYVACIWTALSIAVAASLGMVVLVAALFGLALAWAYSAPPFRLKQNGWWGNAAVGLCYEGLPWFTGSAVMSAGWPDSRIVILALLYSVGAHGIMTLNDFKSVEGDRQLNLRSLPVQMGVENAARLACAVMVIPQAIVIALLMAWGSLDYARVVVVLLGAQCLLMMRLLDNPRGNAAWYNATGTTLYVLGMLAASLSLRS